MGGKTNRNKKKGKVEQNSEEKWNKRVDKKVRNKKGKVEQISEEKWNKKKEKWNKKEKMRTKQFLTWSTKT